MFDASDSAPEADITASKLNPLFHEPVRLAVLSALAPSRYVEFSMLMQLTGASKSALSKHLSALADAGVIEVSQAPADKRARRVALSVQGRSDFGSYITNLERIVRQARQYTDHR